MNVTEQDTEMAALEDLAAKLDGDKFSVKVLDNTGKRACLRVSNRRAGALTEQFYYIDGWFRFSWGERVGTVDEIDHVAKVVTNVLRILGDQP